MRYKFAVHGADGSLRHARRSGRDAHRGPARERVGRVRAAYHCWQRRRLDGAPRPTRRAGPARCRSTRCTRARGAPGARLARPRRAQLADHVTDARVHPRRAHGRAGAPVRGFVGLPGHRLLRADRPVRHARRLPRPRRRAAPARHRRHRRLGARRTSRATTGPWPASTAPRSYEHDDPRRGFAPRLGNPDLQLRPHRGAQLPARERGYLGAGLPRRRAPGRRGRVDALPRLLPRDRASGCPTCTAGARTSTPSSSCGSSTTSCAPRRPAPSPSPRSRPRGPA